LLKFPIDLDTTKRLAGFVARRTGEDRVPQVAGSLTFTTVLSLVPLATVAFALFTAFPIFASFQMSLQDFLAAHLMPSQINSQIFKYLNQFASKAKGLTTVGMIILFVTSVMTMMTVESAFNVIWRVRKSRPLAQRIMVYWAIITLGPILFGVSLSTSSYLFAQSIAFAGSHNLLPPVIEWALASASVPFTVLAFSMLYVFLPNCKVEWRDALVGGLVVYGAFAALPVVLLWVYLCWMITLIGAMLTSALPAIRIGQFHRTDFPGSDLLDALELLARLAEAREAGLPGYTALELARMLRCDMDTSMRLVRKLDSLEWIARLENLRVPRYVLIANPQQITVASLFDLFVIEREELDYQLRLDSSHIDRAVLMNALSNEKLDLTLTTLVAARSASRQQGAREAQGAGAMPHQTA
jgi:membrane protein